MLAVRLGRRNAAAREFAGVVSGRLAARTGSASLRAVALCGPWLPIPPPPPPAPPPPPGENREREERTPTPAKSAPGRAGSVFFFFAYCNAGYVSWRYRRTVSGVPFRSARDRVSIPADGRHRFLRSTNYPPRTATVYLPTRAVQNERVPSAVRGAATGDLLHGGGISSVGHPFRRPNRLRAVGCRNVRPAVTWPAEHRRYGLGFLLHQSTTPCCWRDTTPGYPSAPSLPASSPHSDRPSNSSTGRGRSPPASTNYGKRLRRRKMDPCYSL